MNFKRTSFFRLMRVFFYLALFLPYIYVSGILNNIEVEWTFSSGTFYIICSNITKKHIYINRGNVIGLEGWGRGHATDEEMQIQLSAVGGELRMKPKLGPLLASRILKKY